MTREEAEKTCVYWDCQDSETLRHESPDDAIEALLDGLEPDQTPSTITLKGYVRMEVCPVDVLDVVLERLDEEYGDPDGDATTPTAAMLEAEKAFLAVVEREYQSWACEEAYAEDVDTAAWMEVHWPATTEKEAK